MPDIHQLPHLLKLVDDDSVKVRGMVLKELRSFGPILEEELAKIAPLTQEQRHILFDIFQDHARQWLEQNFSSWFSIQNELEQLETAFDLLARFQSGRNYNVRLKDLLDQLAKEYQLTFAQKDLATLAEFLFKVKEIRGAKTNYYHPQNSNLVYCIENKVGIPISLASIYILVAHRVGLKVEGCNLPGHFLAKVVHKGENFLVDCFNGGEFLAEKEFKKNNKDLFQTLSAKADAKTIIARVLRNAMRAYERQGEIETSNSMLALLKQLENYQNPQKPLLNVETEALFRLGQLVCHKKYGYRGVVVNYDLSCKADEHWYQSNSTQPPRNQPWYHVLVHVYGINTYAAQTSLQVDDSKQEIIHPLVPYFFMEFKDGFYVRNDLPWPE